MVADLAAGAGTASAGGIGAFGNSAFDNTCITVDKTVQAAGHAIADRGLLSGNGVQVPLHSPPNSCGSTDLTRLCPVLSGEIIPVDALSEGVPCFNRSKATDNAKIPLADLIDVGAYQE